jgi:hypothetical protein
VQPAKASGGPCLPIRYLFFVHGRLVAAAVRLTVLLPSKLSFAVARYADLEASLAAIPSSGDLHGRFLAMSAMLRRRPP